MSKKGEKTSTKFPKSDLKRFTVSLILFNIVDEITMVVQNRVLSGNIRFGIPELITVAKEKMSAHPYCL